MSTETKLPPTFWVIAVLATIWNVMGVFQFYMQTSMSEAALQALPEDHQALYAELPSWIPIVFGIATITGLLGSIGLLMRKAWAAPLLLISLLAVLIQMCYNVFGSRMIEVMGNQALIMPIVLAVVSAYLYYFARTNKANGVLS